MESSRDDAGSSTSESATVVTKAAPYGNGTGYERDADACVADRVWKPYDQAKMAKRDGKLAAFELDRVWQGKASGTQPQCRTPFGVYDMVGNVDEWTTSTRATGSPSILKGGLWGPVRARCRPSTRSHGAGHRYYQQGIRCCASHQHDAFDLHHRPRSIPHQLRSRGRCDDSPRCRVRTITEPKVW